jgi:hypothetical protein
MEALIKNWTGTLTVISTSPERLLQFDTSPTGGIHSPFEIMSMLGRYLMTYAVDFLDFLDLFSIQLFMPSVFGNVENTDQ